MVLFMCGGNPDPLHWRQVSVFKPCLQARRRKHSSFPQCTTNPTSWCRYIFNHFLKNKTLHSDLMSETKFLSKYFGSHNFFCGLFFVLFFEGGIHDCPLDLYSPKLNFFNAKSGEIPVQGWGRNPSNGDSSACLF